MTVVHQFDQPDRFVAGTVGEPGSRTFFLQARQDRRIVSVSLEKQQVALLAERVEELLDELALEAPMQIPAMAPLGLVDTAPLEMPLTDEFRAGTMTLSWDPARARIVIEVYPFDEALAEAAERGELPDLEPAQAAEPAEVFLVLVTAGQARAFAQRALDVVGAGRPSCPFCGGAINPEGHLCPRANGFKRRDP